ncbi:hypothetical protein V499_08085 [Pseudogymnoascus sp. VKM F-103]|nr:hypothetical protein V499_08085 [Pseudogymnoascus sp. VKM F-103]
MRQRYEPLVDFPVNWLDDIVLFVSIVVPVTIRDKYNSVVPPAQDRIEQGGFAAKYCIKYSIKYFAILYSTVSILVSVPPLAPEASARTPKPIDRRSVTNTSSSTGGGEAVLGIDRVWAAERRQGEDGGQAEQILCANTTNTTETTATLPQRYQNYRLPPSITTGTIPNRDSDASRLVRARHGISSLGFRDFSPLLCPVQSPGYMNIGGEVGGMILALPWALPRREIRDVCLTWSLRGRSCTNGGPTGGTPAAPAARSSPPNATPARRGSGSAAQGWEDQQGGAAGWDGWRRS